MRLLPIFKVKNAYTELDRKKAVENHHREVPFHLLKDVPDLSVGDSGTGNLLVEGDNLLALKALLPYYAGQVKCIYIDPPYNTGNEGWIYNDNVNSSEIRQWLGKVVGSELEDLTRHDKWLCMMYPRLALLRQFLREDGAIFISIDDNKAAHLWFILDEIFGEENFVANFIWNHRKSSQNDIDVSLSHNYTFCYAKRRAAHRLNPLEIDGLKFSNLDNDPRGDWVADPMDAPGIRENLMYPIVNPITKKIYLPPEGRHWRFTEEKFIQAIKDKRIIFGKTGKSKPQFKRFKFEAEEKGTNPFTIWGDVGTATEGTKELMNVFGGQKVFDTPKPVSLIEKILKLATDKDSIVLDSFAGSGTTAHAVLRQNETDGGNRRFIVIEMDPSICLKVTSERLKRVCNGYRKQNDSKIEGAGSGFRFCRLSEPLFDEKGNIRNSVRFAELARHVYFTETGEPLPKQSKATSPLLGVCNQVAIYLLYNGILKDKSPDGGNVLMTGIFSCLPKHRGPKVIYGTACRIGAARLRQLNITFKQLPYKLKVDAL